MSITEITEILELHYTECDTPYLVKLYKSQFLKFVKDTEFLYSTKFLINLMSHIDLKNFDSHFWPMVPLQLKNFQRNHYI